MLASTVEIGRAATPERSAQKLRSLAVLPVVNFNVGIGIAGVDGPDLTKPELKRQITRLREEIAHDPDDPILHLRLADLLNTAKLDEATNAFIKAAELFRAPAEARPNDGEIQVHFARALAATGKQQEAERILRDAIKNASSNWICWAELGSWLDSKTWGILLGITNKIEASDKFLQLLGSHSSRELTVEKRNEVQARRGEAKKCFERAKSLAPREPAAALSQATHCWHDALTERALNLLTRKEPLESKKFFEIISTPETRAAFARAARLTTTNYAAIGTWGFLESSLGLRKRVEDKLLDTLPASNRKNVLDAISLLEKVSEHSNPRIAAGAFEMLGFLRNFVMSDAASGKAAFRRAVALDPEREVSWEGLAASFANGADFHELAAVCEERLKYDDSGRNRAIYAAILDHLDVPVKAVEQARKAVTVDPNDLMAQICAGALLLKYPNSPNANSEMMEHFAKAMELIDAMTKAGIHDRQLLAPYFLNIAIIQALEGWPDKARETLQTLAKKDIKEEAYRTRLSEIQIAIGN